MLCQNGLAKERNFWQFISRNDGADIIARAQLVNPAKMLTNPPQLLLIPTSFLYCFKF